MIIVKKPKIRFKGFTETWEQRKLGEICSRVQGNDGRMELPTLTISAANGWMKQEDRFTGNIAGKEQKNYTLLHKGELSYNHGNSKLAKYGTVFSLQTYEEALVPRVYHSFKVEIGSADFIEYFFATKMPDRELRKLISSGARMDGLLNIGYDDFMGIKMMFPSVLEQDKIAEYFRAFDHLITLHQRKCENLKKLKKFMLQKLFPQNGESVPKIRFLGFTDTWEQRKFGDVVQVRRGLTYKPSDVQETGVRVLRSSNINEDTFVCGNDDVFVNPKTVNIDTVKQNDILITSANGSSRLVGKHTLIKGIPDESAVHGGFMLLGITKNYDFINASMNSSWYIRFINIYVTGGNGAIGNLSKSDLDEQLILVPSDLEQKKIGEYFANLDHLITLHQSKCDKLKEIKKYMLQNMFI